MNRILIADASESIRRMLRAVLEGAGLQVADAADGADAIQRLAREPHAILLMDLRLPKRGGEMLTSVKAADPNCRVIIMAAYGDIQSAVWAIREGAYDFVTKPIDPDRLIRTVRRALNWQLRASPGGGSMQD